MYVGGEVSSLSCTGRRVIEGNKGGFVDGDVSLVKDSDSKLRQTKYCNVFPFYILHKKTN